MRTSSRCKFSIKFIPKRWFKDEWQWNVDFDEIVTSRPFLVSRKHQKDKIERPREGFMIDIHSLLPSQASVPSLSEKERARKMTLAQLMATQKKINAIMKTSNPGKCLNEIDGVLNRLLNSTQQGQGDTLTAAKTNRVVKDPSYVATKGAPTKKRKKSRMENSSAKKSKSKDASTKEKSLAKKSKSKDATTKEKSVAKKSKSKEVTVKRGRGRPRKYPQE